jgi:hypothetical protein
MRKLSVAAVATVVVVGVAGTVLDRYENARYLVAARSILFTRFVDANAFQAHPDFLRAHGLREDGAAVRDDWRRWLESQSNFGPNLARIAAIPDEVTRGEALIRTYSAFGRPRAGCGAVPRLADKIRNPGCCSDHTEIFLSLSPLVGLTAREVGFDAHGVIEIFESKLGRWVMLDPTYGVAFRSDSASPPLSLLDLRYLLLRGEHVARVDFAPAPFPHDVDSILVNIYTPSRFHGAFFTNGVNVLEEDHLRGRLQWLPKPIVRLIGYAIGVTPGYIQVADAENAAGVRRAAMLRTVGWVFVVIVTSIVVAPLVSWMRRPRHSSSAASARHAGNANEALLRSRSR